MNIIVTGYCYSCYVKIDKNKNFSPTLESWKGKEKKSELFLANHWRMNPR